MLEAKDEYWHPAEPHSHWNESFYFNAFDAKSGWACATRVGATPNRNRRDGFLCLYLPDQTTGFIATSEQVSGSEPRVAAGKIEFFCVEPFRAWQIRYDGPIHHFPNVASSDDLRQTVDPVAETRSIRLELDITPFHEPFDFDRRTIRLRPLGEMMRTAARQPTAAVRRTLRTLGSLSAMVGAHHFEQSTRVRGTITLDGAIHVIDGFGQRDRSWGVRDMRAPARWRWLSCQFGRALCFNATQVDVLAMRVQGGFVLDGDSAEPIERWHFQARHGTSTYWPDDLDLTIATTSGRELEIHADIVTPLPVVAATEDGEALVTAARAIYRWEDQIATGMVEFMEQLS
ncbi:MAG: hypothetical protein WBG86_07475 [Polyangiales bacterium]